MLEQLNLNKFLIILLLVASSCGGSSKDVGVYHTELICPDMDIILIRYAKLDEIKEAIKNAYENKRKFRTSESFTAILLKGNRSMKIDKLKPEDAINCNLREIYYPVADKYKKKYSTPGYSFFDRH